jgi:hypothetical protein
VLNRGYTFQTRAADSQSLNRDLKTATVTEIDVSRLRDVLEFFSFLSSAGTLMGMIFAAQKG